MGYDLMKNNQVNIYPYAGFGFRSVDMEYNTPPNINPNATSFRDVVVSDRSVDDVITTINYQAGIGAEWVFTRPTKPSGVLLFVKAGTDQAFKEKSFDFEGVKFKPEFQEGKFQYTIGIKFFGR